MANNQENWINKEQRAKQAVKHTQEMQERYPEKIAQAIAQTKIYDVTFQPEAAAASCNVECVVEAMDTVYACKTYYGNGKMALLNFASYKNPGGGFIGGSKAQEECLCHASFLYNVLSQFTDKYYDWNQQHKNKALYQNRGLYSPDIIFQYEDVSFPCDVITCAAPNRSAAMRYRMVSEQENTEALKARIKFVLDIAQDNKVDTLVLGAFGCGVFGQDAVEVAGIFRDYLETAYQCFKKVVFAIPEGKDGNLEGFRKVFGV